MLQMSDWITIAPMTLMLESIWWLIQFLVIASSFFCHFLFSIKGCMKMEGGGGCGSSNFECFLHKYIITVNHVPFQLRLKLARKCNASTSNFIIPSSTYYHLPRFHQSNLFPIPIMVETIFYSTKPTSNKHLLPFLFIFRTYSNQAYHYNTLSPIIYTYTILHSP